MSGIKEFALKAAAAIRGPQLYHALFGRRTLGILMYHGIAAEPLPVADWCFISAAEFRWQMAYLAKHCRVLPLSKAIEQLRTGTLDPGRPAISITFDDGYQNNHDVALQILKQFHLPATIFLATAFIGGEDTVWFCRLHQAIAQTKLKGLEWRRIRFNLETPAERSAASSRLQALLKNQPHVKLLEETEALVDALGGEFHRPIAPDSPFRMLDELSIARCLQSGLIEFGAHTRRHTILSFLTEAEEQDEIAGSVDDVARMVGGKCGMFAYPNGRNCDFRESSINQLKTCGIGLAVTTDELANVATTDPLRLGRYGIGSGTTSACFAAQVHGLLGGAGYGQKG